MQSRCAAEWARWVGQGGRWGEARGGERCWAGGGRGSTWKPRKVRDVLIDRKKERQKGCEVGEEKQGGTEARMGEWQSERTELNIYVKQVTSMTMAIADIQSICHRRRSI